MGCSIERNFSKANDIATLLSMIREENSKIQEYLNTIEEKESENYINQEIFLKNAEKIEKKIRIKNISRDELEKLKRLLTDYYECFDKIDTKKVEERTLYLQDYINFCLLNKEIKL